MHACEQGWPALTVFQMASINDSGFKRPVTENIKKNQMKLKEEAAVILEEQRKKIEKNNQNTKSNEYEDQDQENDNGCNCCIIN
ncbi:MAG: hypothetical protein GY730_11130, partial [bacterium]|nr:hypothetical protein [bacterium]